MRTLPVSLADALRGDATTLCHGWRLTRRDGLVLGFTDHDRDLDLAGITFRAATGIAGSENTLAQGLNVTGGEVSGALSAETLDEAALAAGHFDGAAIDLFLIDWTDPASHALLRRGTIGEVRREGGAFTAEVRGLADALNQTRGRVFSPLCDADLGDARCRVDLSQAAYRASGTVDERVDAVSLRVSGVTQADGWFTRGRIVFTGGASAGFACEVKTHAASTGGVVVQLWQRPPEGVAVGDGFTLTAGCDKLFATCRDRFANALNFRGCPHMPGNDFVVTIAVPGEGGYDGSTLA